MNIVNWATFCACLFLCAPNSPVSAQDDMVEALKTAKTFISVRQADVDLESIPVLTTTNPTRGAALEGTMLLWLSQGRPTAAMCIYAWDGKVMHECDSLSRTGNIVATARSGTRWMPQKPGVTFRPLSSDKPSETSEAQRLQKMRSFAKQFEVTMLGFNDQNSDREQLRLLTTPVYRYQLKDNRTLHRDLIDGAVFAFAQGTDPEALLIVELVQHDDKPQWEYAMVRATAGALQTKRNNSIVFDAAKFPENNDPTLPHFTFSHEVSEINRK